MSVRALCEYIPCGEVLSYEEKEDFMWTSTVTVLNPYEAVLESKGKEETHEVGVRSK